MDEKPFWQIVEAAYRPNLLDHFEAVNERLGRLKWFELIEFQARLDERVAAANRVDLWGAAYLIKGGCSDDGFVDFRAWLIGRGRRVYEAALRDPDSLADVLDGEPVDGFGLDAAALGVYESKTGMSDFYDRLDRAKQDAPTPPLEGADWDFDDENEMKKRFPRLCHLYLIPADEKDEIVEGD